MASASSWNRCVARIARQNCIRTSAFAECDLEWDCKANVPSTMNSAAPGPMMMSRSGPVDFGACVVKTIFHAVFFESVPLLCKMVLLSVHHCALISSCVLCSLGSRRRPEHVNVCMHPGVTLILIVVECISLHIDALNLQFHCSVMVATWRRGSRYQKNVRDDAAPLSGISLFWLWFQFAI